MLNKILLVIVFIVVFSGCSIKQEVEPLSITTQEKMICLIEDKAVRSGFLLAYMDVLKSKDYTVKLLPKGTALDSCNLLSTYMGKWSWDGAIYLALAEIYVYENGEAVGTALYDSRSGGLSLAKFVNGETKIKELVNQLFP